MSVKSFRSYWQTPRGAFEKKKKRKKKKHAHARKKTGEKRAKKRTAKMQRSGF